MNKEELINYVKESMATSLELSRGIIRDLASLEGLHEDLEYRTNDSDTLESIMEAHDWDLLDLIDWTTDSEAYHRADEYVIDYYADGLYSINGVELRELINSKVDEIAKDYVERYQHMKSICNPLTLDLDELISKETVPFEVEIEYNALKLLSKAFSVEQHTKKTIQGNVALNYLYAGPRSWANDFIESVSTKYGKEIADRLMHIEWTNDFIDKYVVVHKEDVTVGEVKEKETLLYPDKAVEHYIYYKVPCEFRIGQFLADGPIESNTDGKDEHVDEPKFINYVQINF